MKIENRELLLLALGNLITNASIVSDYIKSGGELDGFDPVSVFLNGLSNASDEIDHAVWRIRTERPSSTPEHWYDVDEDYLQPYED